MKAHCRKCIDIQLKKGDRAPLSQAESAFLAKHFAVCDACRDERAALDVLEADRFAHRQLSGVVLANRRLEDAVLRRLAEKKTRDAQGPSSRARRVVVGVGAAAAAAVLIFLTVRSVSSIDRAMTPLKATAPISYRMPKIAVKPNETQAADLSRSVMTLGTDIRVSVDPGTRLHLDRTGRVVSIVLQAGTVIASLPPAPKGKGRPRLSVETHLGTVVVKGTIFSVSDDGDDVTVSVLRGEVAVVQSGKTTRTVNTKERFSIRASKLEPMSDTQFAAMSARAERLSQENGIFATHSKSKSRASDRASITPKGRADPSSSDALFSAAEAARAQRDWPRATALFTEFAASYPDLEASGLALISLGEIYLEQLNNPNRAAHFFAAYRETRPEGPLVQDAMVQEIP